MTTKTDYTDEEWNTIVQSPMAAAMVVILASPSGPIGLTQETFAVSKALADSAAAAASNGLIASLAAQLQDSEGRKEFQPHKPEKGEDLAKFKAGSIETLTKLNAILDAKSTPEEATGFKQWLVLTTTKVAGAAKEGGFLGIGGTMVTPEETAAIAEVAATLGINPPTLA